MGHAVIEKTFAFHKPSAESLKRITTLREQFSALSRLLVETCPPSTERALAMTELETAAMWAIKAVVINDPASEAQTA